MAGTGKVPHQSHSAGAPKTGHLHAAKPAAKPAAKTGHLNAPKPAAKPAHGTKPMPSDHMKVAGGNTGKVGSHSLPEHPGTAGAAAKPPLGAHEARQRLEHLQQNLKQARTPGDVHTINQQAQELKTRAAGDSNLHDIEHFSNKLQKTDAAVGKLHRLDGQINGSAHDKASATAEALAHPNQLKGAIKDLKALKGSPLFDKQQGNARDIAAHARPEALGKQLAHDPNLAHYGPEMAKNLGKLRGLPDKHLQAGIDKVGEHLLAQAHNASKPGGNPAENPLTLDKVKADPGLGRIIAPLSKSHDAQVRQQVNGTVQGWVHASLANNLKANDRPGDPKLNAKNTFNGFNNDLKQLAKKTGLGEVIGKQAPQAMHNVAIGLAGDKNLKLDNIKRNPAYGEVLGSLNRTPGGAARVDAKVKGLIHDSAMANLDGKKGNDGVKDAYGGIQGDLTALGEAGLGDNVKRTYQGVLSGKDIQNKVHDDIEDGKSFFDKLKDKAEGALGDAAGFIGKHILDFPGTTALGEGLKLVGLKGAGNFIEQAPTKVLEAGLDTVGLHGVSKQIEGFRNGFGDAIAGTITGLGTFVFHPKASIKGIANTFTHPDQLAKAAKGFWNEMKKGGIGHALGYATGEILPAVLTGGDSLAAIGGKGLADVAQTGFRGVASFAGEHGLSWLEKGAKLGERGAGFAKTGIEAHLLSPSAGGRTFKQVLAGVKHKGIQQSFKDLGSGLKRGSLKYTRTLRHPIEAIKASKGLRQAAVDLRHPVKGVVQQTRAIKDTLHKARQAREAGNHHLASVRLAVARDMLKKSLLGRGVKAVWNGRKLITNPAHFLGGAAATRILRKLDTKFGLNEAHKEVLARGNETLDQFAQSGEGGDQGAGESMNPLLGSGGKPDEPSLDQDIEDELAVLNG